MRYRFPVSDFIPRVAYNRIPDPIESQSGVPIFRYLLLRVPIKTAGSVERHSIAKDHDFATAPDFYLEVGFPPYLLPSHLQRDPIVTGTGEDADTLQLILKLLF